MTLIPDKFRPIDSNKAGLYPHPIFICLRANGKFFFMNYSPLKKETKLRILKGQNGNWDLGKFSLGKWDLGHWDWDLVTGNGNHRQKNNRTGTEIFKIWKNNRLGNGIWAKFGLGKSDLYPPFRTLKAVFG